MPRPRPGCGRVSLPLRWNGRSIPVRPEQLQGKRRNMRVLPRRQDRRCVRPLRNQSRLVSGRAFVDSRFLREAGWRRPSGRFVPNRDWIRAIGIESPIAMSANQWLSYCGGKSFLRDFSAVEFDAGTTWMLGGTVYSEFLVSGPPNTQIPDCGDRATVGIGVFAARSLHPGGVNAVMADGSARFCSNGIEISLWRGLGTPRCRDRP